MIDDIVKRYFPSNKSASISQVRLEAGLGRCFADIQSEDDEEARFGMWAILALSGREVDIEQTFATVDQQARARHFLYWMSLEKCLSTLIETYFGTDDFGSLAPSMITGGIARCQCDLMNEEDRRNRFVLWAFLSMLGVAPGISSTFENKDDRDAAERFISRVCNSSIQQFAGKTDRTSNRTS